MREHILRFLENEVELNHIPGAVVQVMHQNQIVLQEAVGSRFVHLENKEPMKLDTIFDLASLTKVIATLPAVLGLIDKGEIRLDDPVTHFFPGFGTHGKENIRLRHLLTHTSGLPAHRQYHKNKLNKEEILDAINQEQLVAPVNSEVLYTDLGFMLLFRIVEKVTEQSFDTFLQEQFFQPLGMTETGFCPSFHQNRYAATEYVQALNDYKIGVVHDENSESMGGISGHAGLFSCLNDLTCFARMMENDGVYNGKRFLSKAALRLSRANFTAFSEEHRGLAWMRKSPYLASCGDYFSEESYGHTGFTGTSIWFDPIIQLNVILLTNSVHYGRHNHMIRLRPLLHNIIRSYF